MSEDWKSKLSNQIIVIKKEKELIEMQNKLCPAPSKFPWHIHADGMEEGYSRIRVVLVDYSNKKKNDLGESDTKKSVSVYANLGPEQVKYLYVQLCLGYDGISLSEQKFFAEEGEKYGTVTFLDISRHEYDMKGIRRKLPWCVSIRNGSGEVARNGKGGKYCRKGTYEEKGNVSIYLDDLQMFKILSRTCAVIDAFEQKQLYCELDMKNFKNLYVMLKKEMSRQLGKGYTEYYEKRNAA